MRVRRMDCRSSGSRDPANVPALKLPSAITGFSPRLALALLAGLLLGLAFPTPGWAGLAWLVPGALMFSAIGLSGPAAFRLGYAAGLVSWLVSMRWLLNIPFPAGAVAGWLALSGYLALFTGTWVWLATRFVAQVTEAGRREAAAVARPRATERNRLDDEASAVVPPADEGPWRKAIDGFAALPWFRRAMLGMSVSVLWVSLEMVQARLFTGFPWNFLGVAFWKNGPLIQIASVTGVYGVSFIVCWCSVALGGALLLVVTRPVGRFAWIAEGRLPLITLLIIVGIGLNRMLPPRDGARPTSTVSVALVQPSIPQQLIWDDSASPARFQKAFDLSRQAIATKPDVLVWPEGFLPGFEPDQLAAMTNLIRSAEARWVFGADDRDVGPDGKPRFYNAAVVAAQDGRFDGVYRKRRLVIFGEYVPLAKQLPFLRWLTPIGDGFTAGDRPAAFRLGGADRPVVASPVICFEDIFPHHTRSHVAPETDFLLELTNDGWFGESGAQWQHCANASFRAVENGVPLVRCANNGVTCWIDGSGRLRDFLGEGQGDVHAPGFLLANIPVRAAGDAAPAPTFYHEHGDVFGWACVALSVLTAGRNWQASRRR
jgi:apolipoprotein N-acyltransferase